MGQGQIKLMRYVKDSRKGNAILDQTVDTSTDVAIVSNLGIVSCIVENLLLTEKELSRRERIIISERTISGSDQKVETTITTTTSPQIVIIANLINSNCRGWSE